MARTKKVEEVKQPVPVIVKTTKKVPAYKTVDSEPEPESESESELDNVSLKKKNTNTNTNTNVIASKPSVYITNSNLKSTDSDRIHLAQAINNFTLKSEQLIQEMKNFDTFRESVAKLDMLIDTKKLEYNETCVNLEQTHRAQIKQLESEYAEMNKKLKYEFDDNKKKSESELIELRKKSESDITDRTKKLESEFADKKKALTNTYDDSVLDMKRKIAEDKTKQSESYAKELKMRYVK